MYELQELMQCLSDNLSTEADRLQISFTHASDYEHKVIAKKMAVDPIISKDLRYGGIFDEPRY